MRAPLQLAAAALLAAAAVVLGGRQWVAAVLVLAAVGLVAHLAAGRALAAAQADLERLRKLAQHVDDVLTHVELLIAELGGSKPLQAGPVAGKPLKVTRSAAKDVR